MISQLEIFSIPLSHLDYRLLALLKKHSVETWVHSWDVAVLVGTYLSQKNMTELDIKRAMRIALFHDIGKLLVPVKILHVPRKTTSFEQKYIDLHVIFAMFILNPFDLETIFVARHHHNSIFFDKRINRLIEIADVFSALTLKRCYKPSFSTTTASQIMIEMQNKTHKFDNELLLDFLNLQFLCENFPC